MVSSVSKIFQINCKGLTEVRVSTHVSDDLLILKKLEISYLSGKSRKLIGLLVPAMSEL